MTRIFLLFINKFNKINIIIPTFNTGYRTFSTNNIANTSKEFLLKSIENNQNDSNLYYQLSKTLKKDEKVLINNTNNIDQIKEMNKIQLLIKAIDLDDIKDCYNYELSQQLDFNENVNINGKIYNKMTLLQKELVINPFSSKAYYQLGLIYKSIDMVQDSINVFKLSIAHDSSFTEAYLQLGIQLQLQLQQNPHADNSNVYFEKGYYSFWLTRKQLFLKVLEAEDKNQLALYHLSLEK